MKIYYKTPLCLAIFVYLMFNCGYGNSQTFNQGELMNGPGFGYGGVRTLDADHDGDLDILSFPYMYINDSHGNRQKMLTIGNTKKEYESYSIEDMDRDKDMDIVVLYKDGTIDILINEIKGFTKKAQKAKVNYMPAEYAKLYLYDANSDGIRDIIILGLRGAPVAYIGDSNLQFSYFRQFNEQFPKLYETFGLDINKDGIQELLVFNSPNREGETSMLNSYTFKEGKYTIAASVALPTRGFRNPRLTDIDKDGDLDLVYSSGYSNGGIYWIERNSKGGLGKTNTLIDQLDHEDFQLGDFDYDGDLDLSYTSRKNQYTYVNWAKNLGNNVFAKNSQSLLPNIGESISFVFEDFDGDKVKDVVFYYDDKEQIRPRYKMVLQQKDGKIKGQSDWITSNRCSGFVFTDLDSDGTKDVVGYYNNELFYILIDSKGKYSDAKELSICPFKIETLKCSDIDNDGKDDLIVKSDDRENGKLGWLKNEGALKFSPITLIHDEKERLISCEIIDYNNDGNNDLAVNYWFGKTKGIYVYKNVGNGLFAKERTAVMITQINDLFPRLAIWDVNRDGINDIVDNGSKNWFKYSENDNWIKQSSPFQERFINGISKANFDNDNNPDCLMFASGPPKWLEHSNNDQWLEKPIPVNFGIEEVKVGDINSDGFDDIVCLANKYDLAPGYHDEILFSYQYSIITMENDQSGNFTAKTLFPVANLTGIELHDIDNDGDLDIITSGYHWPSSGIIVWKNIGKK